VENKERWQELCVQAATEQDSKKLALLVAEITRLLDEKSARLKNEPLNIATPTQASQ
jgi:hypothetical protein